jgi:MFS family permease
MWCDQKYSYLVKTFSRSAAILRIMEDTLNARAAALTPTHWLIFFAAGLGFAFDMYEVVVQTIVLRPVLMELGLYQPGTPDFNRWAGIVLFLPTTVGGMFALLGGYLTDRLGRQRVLVWSIVLYAIAAFCSGLATSIAELIFWRSITIAGACVEFVAAIAWLTELFPHTRRREAVLGYSQICATLGNFMIAGAYYAAVTWGDGFPAVQGGHSAWRYALMFGAVPAIPLIILRPFLPESPVWQAKRAAGTLRRPRIRELFGPRLRRVTIVSTLLVMCCYALAFGMLQHIPRIVPGLPQVAALARQQQEQWVSWVHLHVDIGALLGRIVLAVLAGWLVTRRPLLRGMLWGGLALFPLVFLGPALNDAGTFKYAVLLVSMCVSMQYSFWGNYLPRVFPVHLRGTGESFAMSFGGRVLAPLCAIATTQLSNVLPGATPTLKLAHSMALVVVIASLCALTLSRWLPEPSPELPED